MNVLELNAKNEYDIAETIKIGLRSREVVVIRNVTGLDKSGGISAYEFANLMKQVGRVWTTQDELAAEMKFQLPGHPEIIEIAHDGLLGSRDLPLHSDASHHPARPYPARALRPTCLPEDSATTTSWYSMYECAKNLTEVLRNQYRNVVCWHQPAYGTGWPGRWARLIEVDPWSGQEYVAYDKLFVKDVHIIIEDTLPIRYRASDEFRVQMENEIDRAMGSPYVHTWELGDIVVWNNRGTLHSRTSITSGQQRRMWRITFDRS